MATSAEQRAKMEEWEVAETATAAAKAEHDADVAAQDAAIQKATESRANWIAKLKDWRRIDDELDALVQEVEPPALPEE